MANTPIQKPPPSDPAAPKATPPKGEPSKVAGGKAAGTKSATSKVATEPKQKALQRVDAIVLGAGIVGVSAALNLLKRNRSVMLVDKSPPGEATSYGNAGVVHREAFYPVVFPRGLKAMLTYARNDQGALHYNPRFLPHVASWLLKLRAASAKEPLDHYADAMNPLLAQAASEHGVLAGKGRAVDLFRGTGLLKGYRTEAAFEADAKPHLEVADRLGVRYQVLDGHKISDLEPDLAPVFAKAVLWPDTSSVASPGGVTKSYARLFEAMGGMFAHGDARSLKRENDLWAVDLEEGSVTAPDVIVALGPWAMDLLKPLGYRFPLAVKRGYHMHFKARGDAVLERPVVDVAHGYVITPMRQGYRITTGVEFDDRDAPPTPVQLERILPQARALFPLGEAIEREAWMGNRPCFPDSMPIIGPAPKHPGLWLDIGHGHLGFALGPVSGRLLAEMITREMPFVDPAPFSATRF